MGCSVSVFGQKESFANAHDTCSTARLHRLYEQQKTAPEGAVRLGDYVTRWLRWTQAGLREIDRSGLPKIAFACEDEPGQAHQ